MKITHLQFVKYKFREYYCLRMHNNEGKLIGKKKKKILDFIYVKTKTKPRKHIFD